jgi:beta-mannanase
LSLVRRGRCNIRTQTRAQGETVTIESRLGDSITQDKDKKGDSKKDYSPYGEDPLPNSTVALSHYFLSVTVNELVEAIKKGLFLSF